MTSPDQSPSTSDQSSEAEDGAANFSGSEHRVRPKFSWAGLGLLIVGGIVAGVGFALVSLPWIVIGLVVVAVGAGAALYGGLMYDIEGHGASFDDEAKTVPGASANASDPELRHDVEHEEVELAGIRARPGLRPSLQKPAAWMLLIIAVWLFATQSVFYERTPTGRDGTYRVLAAGLVIALPALYLAFVRGSKVAAGLCALAGVGLVLGGFLADHGMLRSAVNEVLCGLLVILLVPLAAMTPRRDLSAGARRPSSR